MELARGARGRKHQQIISSDHRRAALLNSEVQARSSVLGFRVCEQSMAQQMCVL